MSRCRRCVIPTTRPDTEFVDGICSACLSNEKRKSADWPARRRELEALLERGKNGSGYDCIVASSGGKDSTFIVMTLLELGARPLVVTATTCHLTEIGRTNIDNLARYATTIEYTTNRRVRALLNQLGLYLVGDISWPEHVAIFTTPFNAACAFGIPLVFYGECPQEAYGGPVGTEEARRMTRQWVSEFGGFLGLRPADLIGQRGLKADDLVDYVPPSDERLKTMGVEAYFLGQFVRWDSYHNARVAREAGLRYGAPSPANFWEWENLDNAQTGIHDHFMYRKYGFGRGGAQLAVDVRQGRIERDWALNWIRQRDGLFPYIYASVDVNHVLGHIGMTLGDLDQLLNKFTNHELFAGQENRRPLLKEAHEKSIS